MNVLEKLLILILMLVAMRLLSWYRRLEQSLVSEWMCAYHDMLPHCILS